MPPESPPSPRKFLPQPVEESKRSNRASGSAKSRLADGNSSIGQRRALPRPVETTSKSSPSKRIGKQEGKHASRDHAIGITSNRNRPLPQPIETTPSATTSRRFAPDMVETTRRSRRNTDTSTGMAESDKTDHLPGPQDHLPPHMRRRGRPSLPPIPPANSPIASTDQIPQAPESNFSSAKLAKKLPRRHSFRIPDLPAIASTSETEEDSNASDVPSLTTLPSTESDREGPSKRRRKSIHHLEARESQDERSSGYLLTLAARTAEKQLRDQAMAAYPNENVHEPVDHYAVDRDSDDSDVEIHMGKLDFDGAADEKGDGRRRGGKHRRESASGWDMAEMRQHQDRLEQQRQDAWASTQLEKKPDLSHLRSHKANLAEDGPPIKQTGALPNQTADRKRHNEIASQRKAASPPMAGKNLHFPTCLSPKATRMDVHQYPGGQKTNGTETRQHTGLWTPSRGASPNNSQCGLWMGVNAASAQP
ncbi:MAG: hypothetical protein Q9164_004686, partial [Protoblastenia rupestris]